ncbi:MAG: TIR domain-containing protein [Deltaproteobacteria bacterium]|nr:TIR domain-containing protein [Deltaproteobacteria bacterium]
MNAHPFASIQGLWGQAETGSRIFVSYRRDDARGDAGRLTDKLKIRFGDKQIFRDVEAIEAGVDFVEAINQAVSQCAVLLAIIGPNWLKVTDGQGRRRLDDPDDFVRLEIAVALQRNVRVVPVLVGGASMPKAEELPPGLESLARRQAHELSDPRWDFDVGQLTETLEKIGIRPARPRPGTQEGGWRRHKIAFAAGGAFLMIAGYIYSELEDNVDELFSSSMVSSPNDLQGFPGANSPITDMGSGSPLPARETGANVNKPAAGKSPNVAAHNEPVRRPLSYRGFDAIGRHPTVVQVLNPG